MEFILFWSLPGIIGMLLLSWSVGDKPRPFMVWHLVLGAILGLIVFVIGLISFIIELNIWGFIDRILTFKIFVWPTKKETE